MNTYAKFNKSLLTKSISILLGSAVLAPVAAIAQESESDLEVIQVRGMRSSIQESMGIKRDSAGVVDAISAEDIGKFPDTNLAESLQRITGISISRSNGEGSQITARGFGPDFNMVTLNGRAMPGAAIPGGGGTPNSRAFDFANLASESVRGVEVYKTGRASIATGGIGATVNIKTARPLDALESGFTGSVGAKALMDTTNRVGDDVTPEVSGFFNFVDDDGIFGVSLSASVQERDSSAVGAFVNEWRVNPYEGSIPQTPNQTDPNLPGFNGPAVVVNNGPADGQLFAIPADLRYSIADRERKRTNAQLTFQYAPTEDLTATLDYTYSKQDLYEARAEQSIWMDDGYFSELTFDDEVVKTPILIEQERRDLLPRDLGLALQELNQVNENKSVGFNVEYHVNDSLVMFFDVHDSSAEGRPDAPYGTWTNLGLGANVNRGQGADFSGEFPIMTVDFDDVARDNLNGNGVLDQDDVGTAILDMNFNSQRTDITQFRVDGEYSFDDGGINFGVESRSMESTSLQSLTRRTMGNWGIENPGELPADYLTPFSFADEFEDYNTNGIFSQGFTGDLAQIGEFAAQEYGFAFEADNPFATNRTIEEDIFAAYVEFELDGELGGRPYNILAGVRYESTDSTSVANISLPNAIAWEGNNDFNVRFGSDTQDVAVESDYDHVLPSIDFDIEVMDGLKARLSYSKTIARPTYNNLSAAASVGTPSGPTLITQGATATASSGNPSLVPLESDNVDLSVEYYFEDTSYVSLGFYDKRVKNFIGNEQVEESVFGLRDATAGPRAEAAAAELERIGQPLTDTNLFNMVVAMENNIAYDSLTIEQFEAQYDVLPNEDDPLLTFINAKPINNKSANIYGFEIAAQHFFGDTGFGVQANYTTVNGDVSYDITADPSVTQFALVGLSDTANLVAMYEKDGWQGRIAYNWRDKFLDTTSQYVNEPGFTESYSQIDFNVSYQVNDDLSVFLEGINITEENSRRHGRTSAQLWNLEQLGARYALGARYTF
ncbi:TonB-dependent receptor [Paraglaciecola agarilytica]|uniref:TonB-dependent receptor n=1 Tax=Paraglaciecola chathamensis TaxID=368405 RepID=UPI001C07FEDC|nr:TonB-dependent receptor [Paraglaciecola agarilytica]MBU3016193.1 TonB-dependent receptor [Paraglaciecola agarilytica]